MRSESTQTKSKTHLKENGDEEEACRFITFSFAGSRWSFLCSFYKFSMEIWSNGMMEETSVVHHLYVWMRKAWIRSM
ncbi:hypothetical protein Pyn_00304 [Prunus yedoensis var. nudiflora]|uniref:Uncharacterized protein n=1 Tax=Prunus yedoensis var. nudiflora TaxID=2094558 RepID=A0A314YB03_PRUYE|nr:hypothetical protein Pyn_00304 [Prunus yedoensis var. nudiflora]